MNLGQKLRLARKEIGLTLKEVAEISNLSINYLSKIENDKINISVKNFNKLAQTYGKSPASFLPNSTNENIRFVRKKQDCQRLSFIGKSSEIQVLLSDNSEGLEVIQINIGPGDKCKEMKQSGERILMMLKGQISLVLGDYNGYTLEEGDSIRFDSSVKHWWYNSSNSNNASFILISIPS